MVKYRFEQIAINSTEKKKPVEEDRFTYLGLEHLDSGSLKVTRFGSEVAPIGEKLVMHKGDVLFGKRRAYQKKVAIAPFDGIFSAHGMVLRPREDVIDKSFFPLFISSDYFLDAAIKISVGSLSPTINWRDLKTLEFELPDLATQRKLAETLWSINDTMETYKKLIAATDELVKSQFMEQFGDPVKNERGYPVLPFAAFASIDAQMTTDYAKYADYPHIGIDSIEKDTGRLRGYRTVAEDGVKSGKYVFTKDHIIYSKIRPNLNKVALPTFDGLCSADAYPILPNTEICNKSYLAYVLRSQWFLSYIIPLSGRTNMPKANREQINGFTWSLPPLDLQEQFATLVQQSDKSKFAVQSCSNLNLWSSLGCGIAFRKAGRK
ncbi:MAG: restriction endonuclease subunit S [Blautia sp.]|nr:restriction endonuclease subunit S [Blautia sp.]